MDNLAIIVDNFIKNLRLSTFFITRYKIQPKQSLNLSMDTNLFVSRETDTDDDNNVSCETIKTNPR